VKQLIIASTFYQCLSLAAALDAGVLPDAEERILVLANSSQAPELSPALQDHQGFGAVASRFDRVVDLAALLYPRRPVQFSPRAVELVTWQRLLRSHWDLGDAPVQIFMDSVQVNPALGLAAIFDEADLYVHSDGLMTYSPTRKGLPLHLSQRLTGLVCVDLVPGLVPRLLAEEGIAHLVVPRDPVRQLIKEICAEEDDLVAVPEPRPTALILGQYLGSLQLLTRQQETDLHRRMIMEAAARGAMVCVFKPHPSAPPTAGVELSAVADLAGVELIIDPSPEIAEVTMQRHQPSWVISCFSTGLATARYLLGIEAVAVGTADLLASLKPYENSNRVPLVLTEALFAGRGFEAPDETEDRDPRLDLQRLIDAVAYCMQPSLLSSSEAPAREYLSLIADEPVLLRTFFRRRRLTVLHLPGALPPPSLAVRARRWVGRRRGIGRRRSK
jgi:hypothetical protein